MLLPHVSKRTGGHPKRAHPAYCSPLCTARPHPKVRPYPAAAGGLALGGQQAGAAVAYPRCEAVGTWGLIRCSLRYAGSQVILPENARCMIPALASKSWRRHVRYRSLPGKVADLSMQLATI